MLKQISVKRIFTLLFTTVFLSESLDQTSVKAMGTIVHLLLYSAVVAGAPAETLFEADRPFVRVQVHHTAELECCYSTTDDSLTPSWYHLLAKEQPVALPKGLDAHAVQGSAAASGGWCGTLTFRAVRLNDTGFYQCFLSGSGRTLVSHGTYLQVYKPMDKTINLSESTKNRILTVEGVLLLICVLVPSATLLRQSRRLNELEKKKAMKEEENIYQGLNLDECWSAYDQIERSQAHGPYQDVGNVREEEEEIQLEKP
ncbi:B-cell antigen receptor complex-associated protein alpha chain [Pungitius pungitius]|uniref:B-cell antigen receptor complex-associated protein alpha chain n=1 Tax=Pungitius pungitius TaxID=134920 RepID=UPI002E11515F